MNDNEAEAESKSKATSTDNAEIQSEFMAHIKLHNPQLYQAILDENKQWRARRSKEQEACDGEKSRACKAKERHWEKQTEEKSDSENQESLSLCIEPESLQSVSRDTAYEDELRISQIDSSYLNILKDKKLQPVVHIQSDSCVTCCWQRNRREGGEHKDFITSHSVREADRHSATSTCDPSQCNDVVNEHQDATHSSEESVEFLAKNSSSAQNGKVYGLRPRREKVERVEAIPLARLGLSNADKCREYRIRQKLFRPEQYLAHLESMKEYGKRWRANRTEEQKVEDRRKNTLRKAIERERKKKQNQNSTMVKVKARKFLTKDEQEKKKRDNEKARLRMKKYRASMSPGKKEELKRKRMERLQRKMADEKCQHQYAPLSLDQQCDPELDLGNLQASDLQPVVYIDMDLFCEDQTQPDLQEASCDQYTKSKGQDDGSGCQESGKGQDDGSGCQDSGKAQDDGSSCQDSGKGQDDGSGCQDSGKGQDDGSGCQESGKGQDDGSGCQDSGKGQDDGSGCQDSGKGQDDGSGRQDSGNNQGCYLGPGPKLYDSGLSSPAKLDISGRARSREVHSQLEKNRREQLRECLYCLHHCVPSLENQRVGVRSVLEGAAKYISHLKTKDREQEHDIQMLAKKKKELQKDLNSEINRCRENRPQPAQICLKVKVEPNLDNDEDEDCTSDPTTLASDVARDDEEGTKAADCSPSEGVPSEPLAQNLSSGRTVYGLRPRKIEVKPVKPKVKMTNTEKCRAYYARMKLFAPARYKAVLQERSEYAKRWRENRTEEKKAEDRKKNTLRKAMERKLKRERGDPMIKKVKTVPTAEDLEKMKRRREQARLRMQRFRDSMSPSKRAEFNRRQRERMQSKRREELMAWVGDGKKLPPDPVYNPIHTSDCLGVLRSHIKGDLPSPQSTMVSENITSPVTTQSFPYDKQGRTRDSHLTYAESKLQDSFGCHVDDTRNSAFCDDRQQQCHSSDPPGSFNSARDSLGAALDSFVAAHSLAPVSLCQAPDFFGTTQHTSGSTYDFAGSAPPAHDSIGSAHDSLSRTSGSLGSAHDSLSQIFGSLGSAHGSVGSAQYISSSDNNSVGSPHVSLVLAPDPSSSTNKGGNCFESPSIHSDSAHRDSPVKNNHPSNQSMAAGALTPAIKAELNDNDIDDSPADSDMDNASSLQTNSGDNSTTTNETTNNNRIQDIQTNKDHNGITTHTTPNNRIQDIHTIPIHRTLSKNSNTNNAGSLQTNSNSINEISFSIQPNSDIRDSRINPDSNRAKNKPCFDNINRPTLLISRNGTININSQTAELHHMSPTSDTNPNPNLGDASELSSFVRTSSGRSLKDISLNQKRNKSRRGTKQRRHDGKDPPELIKMEVLELCEESNRVVVERIKIEPIDYSDEELSHIEETVYLDN